MSQTHRLPNTMRPVCFSAKTESIFVTSTFALDMIMVVCRTYFNILGLHSVTHRLTWELHCTWRVFLQRVLRPWELPWNHLEGRLNVEQHPAPFASPGHGDVDRGAGLWGPKVCFPRSYDFGRLFKGQSRILALGSERKRSPFQSFSKESME